MMYTLSFVGTKKNKTFKTYKEMYGYLFNYANSTNFDMEILNKQISVYHKNTLYEMTIGEIFDSYRNKIKGRKWWEEEKNDK